MRTRYCGRVRVQAGASASILAQMVRAKLALAAVLLLLAAGCGLEPAPTPADDQTAKPVVTGSITAETKAARAESNKLLREYLTRIADDLEAGRIVYDTKLALEMGQANRDAAKPINDVKARCLPAGKITDGKAAAAIVRQFRDGYQ